MKKYTIIFMTFFAFLVMTWLNAMANTVIINGVGSAQYEYLQGSGSYQSYYLNGTDTGFITLQNNMDAANTQLTAINNTAAYMQTYLQKIPVLNDTVNNQQQIMNNLTNYTSAAMATTFWQPDQKGLTNLGWAAATPTIQNQENAMEQAANENMAAVNDARTRLQNQAQKMMGSLQANLYDSTSMQINVAANAVKSSYTDMTNCVASGGSWGYWDDATGQFTSVLQDNKACDAINCVCEK